MADDSHLHSRTETHVTETVVHNVDGQQTVTTTEKHEIHHTFGDDQPGKHEIHEFEEKKESSIGHEGDKARHSIEPDSLLQEEIRRFSDDHTRKLEETHEGHEYQHFEHHGHENFGFDEHHEESDTPHAAHHIKSDHPDSDSLSHRETTPKRDSVAQDNEHERSSDHDKVELHRGSLSSERHGSMAPGHENHDSLLEHSQPEHRASVDTAKRGSLAMEHEYYEHGAPSEHGNHEHGQGHQDVEVPTEKRASLDHEESHNYASIPNRRKSSIVSGEEQGRTETEGTGHHPDTESNFHEKPDSEHRSPMAVEILAREINNISRGETTTGVEALESRNFGRTGSTGSGSPDEERELIKQEPDDFEDERRKNELERQALLSPRDERALDFPAAVTVDPSTMEKNFSEEPESPDRQVATDRGHDNDSRHTISDEGRRESRGAMHHRAADRYGEVEGGRHHGGLGLGAGAMPLHHDPVMKELEHFGRMADSSGHVTEHHRNDEDEEEEEEDERRERRISGEVAGDHQIPVQQEEYSHRMSLRSEDGSQKEKLNLKHKSMDESMSQAEDKQENDSRSLRKRSSSHEEAQIGGEQDQRNTALAQRSREASLGDSAEHEHGQKRTSVAEADRRRSSGVSRLPTPIGAAAATAAAADQQHFDRRKSSAEVSATLVSSPAAAADRRRSSNDVASLHDGRTSRRSVVEETTLPAAAVIQEERMSPATEGPVADGIREKEADVEIEGEKDFENEIFDTFKLFDFDGNGTIDIKDLGTVLRCLNLNPTQSQIKELRKQFNGDSKKITWSKFYPNVISIIEEGNCKPASEDELVSAFSYLDTEKKGYLTFEQLKHFLLNMGEPLNDEEFEQMLHTLTIGSNPDCFDYIEYAKRLAG